MALKENKKSSTFGLLIFLLFFIGIPVLLTNIASRSSKKISVVQEKESVEIQKSDSNFLDDEILTEEIASKENNSSSGLENNTDNDLENKINIDSSYNEMSALYSAGQNYSKDKEDCWVLKGPVMDTARILSENEFNELRNYLLNLSDKTGIQIVVLTVQSLDGESIESYSMRHAEKWQLGQKGVDNGVLLTVSLEEHELRIETGYGSEGTLTDLLCGRIIDYVLVPAFKEGKYGEGIIGAVKNMTGILTKNEELVTLPSSSNSSASSVFGLCVFLAFFFFFWLMPLLMSIIMSVFPDSKLGSWLRKTFKVSSVRTGSNGGFTGSHSSSYKNSSSRSFGGGGGSFGGGGSSGRW